MPAPREAFRHARAGPGVPLLLYAALVFLPPLRRAEGREDGAMHAALTLAVPALIALAWWAGARLVAAAARRVPAGGPRAMRSRRSARNPAAAE